MLPHPYSLTPDSIETNELADLIKHCVGGVELSDLLSQTDGPNGVFGSRKAFCETLGIGESTIAGWVKDNRLPAMAKAVVGLVHLAEMMKEATDELSLEVRRASSSERIVRDGEHFMIVSIDAESGIGRISARDIPDQATAERLISHIELEDWLKHSHEAISAIIEGRESDLSGLLGGIENLLSKTDTGFSFPEPREL